VGKHKQAGRLLELTTPLGTDELLLQSLKGEEGISQMFSFRLHLLSEKDSLKHEDLIGQKATISIRMGKDKKRYINGIVSRFTQGHKDDRFTHYEMDVVPTLWSLTRTGDCRIFQNKTIPDILKAVLDGKGVAHKSQLTGSYAPREYCVQYRESDFNFVARLMEQYGIFYFFEHTNSSHTMILADSASYKACPEMSKARYEISAEAGKDWEDIVVDWRLRQEMKTGKYSMTDYFFEAPTTNLLVSVPSTVKGSKTSLETYDYPGEYTKKDQGDKIAKVRMEEHEASHLVAEGASHCRSFITGYTFDLSKHYRADANTAYLLTRVAHESDVGDCYYSNKENSSDGEAYQNQFSCILKKIPFRPARVTPLPSINGPQPALVVGPGGNEIWVDKYGRVKVQFYWDREGKKDDNSSCWIRVSQPWAGSNYGAMWIPRIGQEVLVEFLEADPDQPIITGRVYNAQQMPPYTLPDHQTRSTFKSRSSKGGGSSNFNELRFEDKKGSEQVFLHAEKEMDVRVKKDSREHVGENRHLIVKKDQKELVEMNKSLEVKLDHKEKIGKNMSLDVKMNRDEKTGIAWAHEAGAKIHIKAGAQIVIEAGAQISLKVGGSFVDINPAMVSIKGPMVHINSAGAAGSGSGAKPEAPDKPDEADDGSKGTKM